jgi:hypothetical protein
VDRPLRTASRNCLSPWASNEKPGLSLRRQDTVVKPARRDGVQLGAAAVGRDGRRSHGKREGYQDDSAHVGLHFGSGSVMTKHRRKAAKA